MITVEFTPDEIECLRNACLFQMHALARWSQYPWAGEIRGSIQKEYDRLQTMEAKLERLLP